MKLGQSASLISVAEMRNSSMGPPREGSIRLLDKSLILVVEEISFLGVRFDRKVIFVPHLT